MHANIVCVCVCVCVRAADIRGLERCRPLMALPVTLASKQGRKYVSTACHTHIVERFLYGWLEYERICRGWITQAQQVILDNFNLSSRVPKASNSFGKYILQGGGGNLTNKIWLTGGYKEVRNIVNNGGIIPYENKDGCITFTIQFTVKNEVLWPHFMPRFGAA